MLPYGSEAVVSTFSQRAIVYLAVTRLKASLARNWSPVYGRDTTLRTLRQCMLFSTTLHPVLYHTALCSPLQMQAACCSTWCIHCNAACRGTTCEESDLQLISIEILKQLALTAHLTAQTLNICAIKSVLATLMHQAMSRAGIGM